MVIRGRRHHGQMEERSLAGDKPDEALVALARQALQALLSRVSAWPGDTLSIAIPLPEATAAAGVTRATLDRLVKETGFTVAYASIGAKLTLTLSVSSVIPPQHQQLDTASVHRLLERMVDVQASLARQEPKRIDWALVLALLSLVTQVVQNLESWPRR